MIEKKSIIQLHNMTSQQLFIQQLDQSLKALSIYKDLSEQVIKTFSYDHKKLNIKIKIQFPNIELFTKPKASLRCQELIRDKVYICHDCQKHQQAFLCEQCFFQTQHNLKCHYTIRQLPQILHNFYKCSCGDYQQIKYKGTCNKHHHHLQEDPSVVPILVKQKFQSYFIGCFKLLLCLLYTYEVLNIKLNNQNKTQVPLLLSYINNYATQLFQYLTKINSDSSQFLKLSQNCLMQKLSVPQFINNQNKINCFKDIGQNISILGLFYCIKPFFILLRIPKLIEQLLLLQSQEFVRDIFNNLYNNFQKDGLYCELNRLHEYKNKFLIRPSLYCTILKQFAQEGKLIHYKGRQLDTLKFYYQSSANNIYMDKYLQKLCSLSLCWQILRQKDILNLANIVKINKSFIINYLSLLVYNQKLFKELLRQYIKHVHQKAKNKQQNKEVVGLNINLAESCNVLFKLVQSALRMQPTKISQYLYRLDLNNELTETAFQYFIQSIQKPSNLSLISLFGFGIYLNLIRQKEQDIFSKYCELWNNHKVPSEKLTDFLAKSCHMMIGQQLKILSKYSVFSNSKELEDTKQKKLKQFLFMRKIIPKNHIVLLLKQNILSFPKAYKIIQNYTRFDQKSSCFLYCHQQQHFNHDGLFNNIFSLQVVKNFKFNPGVQDQCLTNPIRKAIVLGFHLPILGCPQRQVYQQKLDSSKLSLIHKNKIYTKDFCLVSIDKIADGSIVQLRKYLLRRKQTIQQMVCQANPETEEYTNYNGLNQLFMAQNQKVKLKQQQQKDLQAIQQVPSLGNRQHQLINQDAITQVGQEISSKMMGETQKNIQNIQQIKPEVISTEIKKQITVNEQKASKKSKLLQKFKNKQHRVLSLNSVEIHKEQNKKSQNNQMCMICKSHGSPNNALHYLSILNKEDPNKQVFRNSLIKINYSIGVCMHVMCQKCFVGVCKGNNYCCPLCKKNSNFIMPLQHQILTKNSFQFLENRLIYLFIQNFNEYHADKCFILILKNIISQMTLFVIFNQILRKEGDEQRRLKVSKQQQNKKINYYLNILSNWSKSLQPFERQYFFNKICKLFGIKGSQVQKQSLFSLSANNPKVIIQIILLQVCLQKLFQVGFDVQFYQLFNLLREQTIDQEYNNFISYIQQFLSKPLHLPKKQIQIETRNHSTKKFLQNYFIPPQSIAMLQYMCSSCKKCKQKNVKNNYYCLICNATFCLACKHQKQHSYMAKIGGVSGYFEYTNKKGNFSKRIYNNQFKQVWGQVQYVHDDYFAYGISDSLFNAGLYQWIHGCKN